MLLSRLSGVWSTEPRKTTDPSMRGISYKDKKPDYLDTDGMDFSSLSLKDNSSSRHQLHHQRRLSSLKQRSDKRDSRNYSKTHTSPGTGISTSTGSTAGNGTSTSTSTSTSSTASASTSASASANTVSSFQSTTHSSTMSNKSANTKRRHQSRESMKLSMNDLHSHSFSSPSTNRSSEPVNLALTPIKERNASVHGDHDRQMSSDSFDSRVLSSSMSSSTSPSFTPERLKLSSTSKVNQRSSFIIDTVAANRGAADFSFMEDSEKMKRSNARHSFYFDGSSSDYPNLLVPRSPLPIRSKSPVEMLASASSASSNGSATSVATDSEMEAKQKRRVSIVVPFASGQGSGDTSVDLVSGTATATTTATTTRSSHARSWLNIQPRSRLFGDSSPKFDESSPFEHHVMPDPSSPTTTIPTTTSSFIGIPIPPGSRGGASSIISEEASLSSSMTSSMSGPLCGGHDVANPTKEVEPMINLTAAQMAVATGKNHNNSLQQVDNETVISSSIERGVETAVASTSHPLPLSTTLPSPSPTTATAAEATPTTVSSAQQSHHHTSSLATEPVGSTFQPSAVGTSAPTSADTTTTASTTRATTTTSGSSRAFEEPAVGSSPSSSQMVPSSISQHPSEWSIILPFENEIDGSPGRPSSSNASMSMGSMTSSQMASSPRTSSLKIALPKMDAPPPEWNELLGNKVAEMSDMEKSRQRAIYELITTERTYVSDLHILNVFVKGNMNLMYDSTTVDNIFVNSTELYVHNRSLLAQLEALFVNDQYIVSSIGPTILNGIFKFHIYRSYCVNIPHATQRIRRLCKENKTMVELIHQHKVRNLSLDHIIIEPMQRLTRYKLLIQKILESTPQDHIDYRYLTKSYDVVSSLLNDINEVIRLVESRLLVADLRSRLLVRATEPTIDVLASTASGTRRELLMHGELVKVRSRSTPPLKAYLFNDMLLLTQPPRDADILALTSYEGRETEVVYRRALFFPFQCKVHKDSFTVSWPDNMFSSITLKADSPTETRRWIRAIMAQNDV